MKQILIASSNPGKIREIKEILKGVPFELKTMDEIGFNEEIPETGETFEENAIIKAKTIGEKTKLLTLAEDSGLEVDALEGRPGIYSARYANGSDLNRIDKLLKELKRIPKEKRTARFRAVVALYIPTSVIPNASEGSLADASSDKLRDSSAPLRFARNDNSIRIVTFEGISKGYITGKIIGNNGFGYDPIFYNLDLGKTNGQASIEEKNRVSHRARALKRVKDFLLKAKF
ncbi:non-canonical purine NTP pyrophosphatase [Candidatus Gottesmanbacteria bacterium]|nr:non-canonical purine NTP pyrophosphatase [Candidatus Gottesmanbacteria bacterium]